MQFGSIRKRDATQNNSFKMNNQLSKDGVVREASTIVKEGGDSSCVTPFIYHIILSL